jgi:hypothetical protein
MLKRSVIYSVAMAASLSVMMSCKDDKGTEVDPGSDSENYLVLGKVGTGTTAQHIMLETSSLSEGKVTALGQGVDVTEKGLVRGTIEKDGFFYKINAAAGKFGKYRVSNGALEVVQEVPFTAVSRENWHQWMDDNTLLMCGDGGDAKHFDYAIVNTKDMAVIKSGDLPIPAPQEVMYMGAFRVRENKLYVYYSHYNETDWSADDTSRLAVMDYPALTNVMVKKDTRTTAPGMGYELTPGDLITENGDIYAISGPGPWAAWRQGVPTGIHRIKAGQDDFDPDYFFNTTEASGGLNQQGLWYLGNGKALTRQAGEWYWPEGFDWYVLDLHSQSMTKLDIPRSLQSWYGNILFKEGKVYISADKDYHIYIYDIASGTVTKGAQIEGVNEIPAIYDLAN